MKKSIWYIILLLIIPLMLFFRYHYSHAESWERVVSDGFNDPWNDYAWSMETFQGKLYVGTLNTTGAQIWCSDSGEAGRWKKVYEDRLKGNVGIRCLYNDQDQALYACTLNSRGAQIFRSTDGETWKTVGRRGLGNRKNKTIRSMARFGDYLYAGTGNRGAELYRSRDGLRWEKVHTNPSFTSTKVQDPKTNIWITNNVMIGELAVFNDDLYAFTWTMDIDRRNINKTVSLGLTRDRNHQYFLPPPGAFEMFRSYDGVNWEKVVGQDDPYGNGMGFCLHDSLNLYNDAVTSVTVFKGQMYLGTENSYREAAIWRTTEGTQWEKVLDFYDLGDNFNYYIWRLISYMDTLYVGTMNIGTEKSLEITGAQIWASDSGDPGSFYNLIPDGFDGETVIIMGREQPKNMGIRSFAIFKDHLFAGTATPLSVPLPRSNGRRGISVAGKYVGCEIWKMIP